MQNGEYPNQRSTHIDDGLYNVGPDDGRKAAFKGINQGEGGDDGNGSNLARTERNGHDNRNRINPYALGCRASHEEKSSGQRTELAAEAALDQLIGGIKISAEILRQQNKTDDDPAGQIA